ncbi:hypothetical protein BVRB_4g088100 [Beta vulgaris subsp. vulgaris]|nr:hypothetical protein BVRB_4g088100 [Beta vulgaris subsp. vulgaris]
MPIRGYDDDGITQILKHYLFADVKNVSAFGISLLR